MATIIACVSQKGGVAKSSRARRIAAGIAPATRTAVFGSVAKAVKAASDRDILVIDARGLADRQTAEVAGTADAVTSFVDPFIRRST